MTQVDEAMNTEVRANRGIQIAGLDKVYKTPDGPVVALRDVALTIEPGQFVSVVGPSGCGKSTLLQIVAGLTQQSSGSVMLEGQEVNQPQTQIGLVFQAPTLLRWRTVLDNVLLQAEAKKMNKAEARKRASSLLEMVGLGDFQHKRPFELSGGMQQRVAICRALLHDPGLMLMDEPFGALDAITRDEMNLQLGRLWDEMPRTMLFITHSIPEATFLSDRVIVMCARPGRVVADIHIDLPRPRDLSVEGTAKFIEYTSAIRNELERGRL